MLAPGNICTRPFPAGLNSHSANGLLATRFMDRNKPASFSPALFINIGTIIQSKIVI